MAYNQVNMHVLRQKSISQISSLNLVPGDIVFLKKQIRIPFDGIILEGNALINECALTGESVPIVKKADHIDKYKSQEKIQKNAYVYQGTTVIQTNAQKISSIIQSQKKGLYGIPVCVIRTNFATTKGQLIRTILFPKQKYNLFQRESGKFLLFLFAIVIITFLGMIPTMGDTPPIDVFIRLLDLISIAVPAALPVSMSFGLVYAIEKLMKKSIFCIEESKVIIGGGVNFCCFDKTGTLTQDFMDFQCLIPAQNAIFNPVLYNNPQSNINISALINKQKYLVDIFNNFASNHSIVQLQGSDQLVGDPMQIKLLQFGQFKLNQSNSDPQVLFSFSSQHSQPGFIYKRFDFDFESQRMSVICKTNNSQFHVYTKGSPQIMLRIMDRKSIPLNYEKVLKEYASNGFRVLAIASKKIQPNFKTLMRKQIQSQLIFNGFQVFQNKLKAETKASIKQLRDAQIGVVMITGDNPLTAANIAYKCGISNRSKGTLICDYKNQKFTRQKFNYYQQQQVNQKSDNTLGQTKVNFQMQISFADIEIKSNQPTLVQAKKIIEDEDIIVSQGDSKKYMQEMIKYAKNSNCQLCLTGTAFNKLFEESIGDLSQIKIQFLSKISIFARTTPKDKAKIVMVYQHSGKTVSMCGDGANDCAALKQADIGLSLSQTEASISAPFTSQIANISSMVELIKQCRAGLATNFSLFNIVASYALIQYTTTIITGLYYAFSTDFNYFYWDFFCNFLFIVVIGYTASSDKLSVQIPNNSLFCLTNLMQVLILFGFQMLGQISMILALSQFNDEISYSQNGGMDINSARYQQQGILRSTPQTNILFLFANFMYISTLLAFTISRPWKKQVYTNIPFMFILSIILAYSIIMTVVPDSRLAIFYLGYMTSSKLNGFVLGIALAFAIFIILLQKGILEPFSLWLRRKYPALKWL